ncbi:hypothetical protein WJX79_005042 [Trebouxia sp. C0005]
MPRNCLSRRCAKVGIQQAVIYDPAGTLGPESYDILQAPVLHSTASSGFAISVLSQQDCVSALVTAAQQGPDPRTCQDGISHPQQWQSQSSFWCLANPLHWLDMHLGHCGRQKCITWED